MVTLVVAAFFAAIGFFAFFGGWQFELPTVSFMGALMFVGLGAVILNGGLTVASGTTVTQVTNATTEVQYQYRTVQTPDNFPLGVVTIALGGVGGLRALDRYN